MSSTSQDDLLIDAPLPPQTPLQQGRFVVGQVLGRGGFGITYRAQKDSAGTAGQAVAIKEFFPQGSARRGLDLQFAASSSTQAAGEQRSALQNFLNEARVLAALHHPGIVRVEAVFQENNTAYLVMELLDGLTLQEVVESRGPLPEDEALIYIKKIGAALGEVHRANFIHRDIKAENIIIGSASNLDDTRVTLLDFGLNKEIGAAGTYHTLRLTNALRFGSPGYSPPEQYGRQAQFGTFTDIYSLGALLYYLLSGQLPPDAPERMCGEELTPLRRLQPEVSPAVSEAVAWALQLKGEARPQTVAEFLEALHPSAATQIATANLKPVAAARRTAPPSSLDAPIASATQVSPQPRLATGRIFVALKESVARLAGRFVRFLARSLSNLVASVARSLKRAASNLWLEFLNILPRLLLLAAIIAAGIFLVRQQERKLQQRQLWQQRLKAKQNQVKKSRANQQSTARNRRQNRRSQ